MVRHHGLLGIYNIRGLDFMTIIVGSMAAIGTHGSGRVVAQSSHLETTAMQKAS